MPTLLFQDLIDRIRQDDRPLQPSIYAELGALLAKLCDINPGQPLSEEAQSKASVLLREEIRSPNSYLKTHHQFAAIFRSFCVKHLFPNDENERLIMAYLEACKQDFRTQSDENSFTEAMADQFNAPEGAERSVILAYGVNWLGRELSSTEINREARYIVCNIIEAAFAIHLRAQPSRQVRVGALSIWRPRPTPTSSQPGPLNTRRDLTELTKLIHFWLSLHHDDQNKTNFVNLVELLEIASENVDEIDFSQVDFLNNRTNIFSQKPKPTEPFYDGDI